MKLHRTDAFRINFNEYQHAYFTVLSKYYEFCLNLLVQWIYDYFKSNNVKRQLLEDLDYYFRRYGFRKILKNFPSRLFETVYRKLPSAIAGNSYC